MTSPSVSFRISRNAEDLASTIHALSQRLLKLEQRLVALEGHIAVQAEVPEEELASLDNVERLLRDCRDLLEVAEACDALPLEATAEATADGSVDGAQDGADGGSEGVSPGRHGQGFGLASAA